MALWLIAVALVGLSGYFFHVHALGASMVASLSGWGLTVFLIIRGILRWVGRQLRGERSRG